MFIEGFYLKLLRIFKTTALNPEKLLDKPIFL